MKRLLSIVMLLLSVVGIYADNPVTVKAGNPVVFNETSQALVVVDYSKTMVKDQTLDAYLKREFEIIFKKVKSRKTSNLQRVATKWSPVKIM